MGVPQKDTATSKQKPHLTQQKVMDNHNLFTHEGCVYKTGGRVKRNRIEELVFLGPSTPSTPPPPLLPSHRQHPRIVPSSRPSPAPTVKHARDSSTPAPSIWVDSEPRPSHPPRPTSSNAWLHPMENPRQHATSRPKPVLQPSVKRVPRYG